MECLPSSDQTLPFTVSKKTQKTLIECLCPNPIVNIQKDKFFIFFVCLQRRLTLIVSTALHDELLVLSSRQSFQFGFMAPNITKFCVWIMTVIWD